ncbi:MAG: hypothetical protein N3F67_01450 [Acidilobaceae archaeon]|nr:hypothetical protein [Acidilobaceae archaeon]
MVEDAERRWIALMYKTAKKYHKLCPYFDKKAVQCLLMATLEGKMGRCDRDGKFEGCPVFTKMLEKLYRHYTENRKALPRDFQDVISQAFTL